MPDLLRHRPLPPPPPVLRHPPGTRREVDQADLQEECSGARWRRARSPLAALAIALKLMAHVQALPRLQDPTHNRDGLHQLSWPWLEGDWD